MFSAMLLAVTVCGKVSVPAGAGAPAVYAAEELRDYTARICGEKLAVVTNDAAANVVFAMDASVPEQGFRIEAKDGKVRLFASQDVGLLYGVYEILEKFGGVRWYTSWMEKVPRAAKLEVPDGYADAQAPDFLMRAPFWWDFNQHVDFATRLRVNGEWHAPKAKHGGAPYKFASDIGGHSFNILCPVKEYGAKHPEWFTKDKDGNSMGKTGRYCQLCCTNPELTDFLVGRMAEKLRADPGKKLIGLMQNDNQHPCLCPDCQRIIDENEACSGAILHLVNNVAARLEKEFPDVRIVTFAYQYTQRPPKKIRPRRNVMVELCSVGCDFSASVDVSLHAKNKTFVKDAEGWAAITDRLYVWDYSTDFSHYLAPYPNVFSQQGNYRFFRRNKVKYLFEQGAYTSPKASFAELKGYLQAKLMWNVDADVEALMQDFFTGYYGKAAPYVRTYMDALHAYARNDGKGEIIGIGFPVTSSVFPDEFFDRAEMLWDLAAKAVADEPECYRRNVRYGALCVWYAQYCRCGGSKGKAAWLMEDPAPLVARLNRRGEWAKKLMDVKREIGRTLHPGEWPTFKPDPFFTDLAAAESNGFPVVTAPAGVRKAVIEETFMRVPWHWGAFVDDPKAHDGRAMKIFANNAEWSGGIDLDNLAVDPGRGYRMRLRVRVQLKPGADRTKKAFSAGIYDAELQRAVDGGKEWKIGDIPDNEYHWYDFAVWPGRMGGKQFVWIWPGSFNQSLKENPGIEGYYIDCLEIEAIR